MKMILAIIMAMMTTMAGSERRALEEMYAEMYQCMISKDTRRLGAMMDDGFVLVHMTGVRQSKGEYLRSIDDGTLNYFSCDDTQITSEIKGDRALLVGKSHVNSAVYGGGRHTWKLRLDISLAKKNGRWLMTGIKASTF